MKKIIFCWLLSVFFLSTTSAQYEVVRTGYEGDYFSLQGALDLFKQSYTLSDFERKLNTEDNWVNNLDLNYDGRIDYIRVEHRRQRNFHAIILQAVLGRYDVQDVAVIEIEILGRREAILQIIGDEDLYGEEVIVEPVAGYSDSRRGYHSDYGGFVNVYYWDPVRYILGPRYQVYVSPYRWTYYPAWWSPWVQCSWNIFRPRIVIYHRHYHVAHVHRMIRVHNFYRTYRSYSYDVVQRTNRVRVQQGKPPVHRPAPAVRRDARPGNHRSRNNVAERPGRTDHSGTPGQSPSVSRKRTTPSSNQRAARNTTPRADQGSRSSANSPAKTRSTTPVQRSAEKSRRATSSNQKEARRTTPHTNQRSPATRSRSRAANPSKASGQRPAASHKATPPAIPKASRSAPPSVQKPSRKQTARPNTTTRSSTSSRSATSTRKPSTGSRTSGGASKPKADNKSTATKKSSSKRAPRSKNR